MAYMSAFCAGLGYPSLAIVLGSITNSFDPNSESSIKNTMLDLLKNILIVAFCLWLLGYLYYALFQQLAERIAYDLRGKYLRALLKQEVGFFEKNNVESMPSDIGQYFQTISTGIGESYGQLCQSIGLMIGGLGIAFYRGPVFAAVCLAYMPFMLTLLIILGSISKKAAFAKLKANKDLGGFTEESISALKLIVSFNQEERAVKLYEAKSKVTRDIGAHASGQSAVV